MKDECCFVCRGRHGRCLTAYRCDHHRRAIEDDDLGRTPYPDPTGNTAARRADADRGHGRKRRGQG